MFGMIFFLVENKKMVIEADNDDTRLTYFLSMITRVYAVFNL